MVRKLLLTPPDVPGETQIRQLEIPSSQQWLGIFNQAILTLVNQYNYEQLNDTDLTPEETAALCYAIYEKYLKSVGSNQVPAPYWDDPADVDSQAPKDDQTWYGTVSDPEAAPDELTFVENALVWIFTGFVAAATWEIGLAPAILFHTIAPKFLLAQKRGDFGEVIRILVDGQEAARVDTSAYSPGDIVTTPIITDPSITTGHDVMIIQVS